MKNSNYIKKNIQLILLIVFVSFVASCESDFNQGGTLGTNKNKPIIHSVSEASEDIVVNQGVLEGMYIIRGENLSSMVSIHFNGKLAGFNPALLTDEIAFVKVPKDAPYINQKNIMRVETLGGVVEYDFSLLTIESFTEGFVNGKKVVTLIGGDFSDAASVTFVSGSKELGNLVEKPADVLSVTQTEVVAEVPDGVEQAFIYLATTRGAVAKSDSYGFTYSIYIDELNPDWMVSGWGGTQDLASTEITLGANSIKSIREGWSGLTFFPETVDVKYSDYQSITVQVYAVGDITRVNLALNDFETFVELSLVSGQWTKFVIPLKDFYPNGGEPDEIFRIDFQEASNTGLPQYIFYVDDFGFL